VLILLLMAGGMDTFDSICHAFTTTGTGGFSTKQASIAYYNSPYIEYVITIFMFLSGINFTMLLCLVTGRFRKFFSNAELKWYIASTLFFTVFVTCWLFSTSDLRFEEAFRESVFQVVSIHTSTGFATADYMTWAPILWATMLVIMIIGACAGSTSGGVKCIRLLVLFKIVRNEFKHIIHPNAVLPVRVNKQAISPSIRSTILAFTFLYALIIIVSTLTMMGLGMGFIESLSCAVSSLGNMGPGLGTCGPAYSWDAIPDAAKWINSLLMLLGRLEIFTVLLLFTSGFWQKN
jgi:trk system potassium uptake protein TrkH